MLTKFKNTILFHFLLCIAMFTNSLFGQEKIKLFITDFDKNKELSLQDMTTIKEIISSDIQNSGKYEVIKTKKISICNEINCAIELGIQNSAQEVLYVNINKLGTKFFLSASLVDVSTKHVIYSERLETGSIEGFSQLSTELSTKLTGASFIKPVKNELVLYTTNLSISSNPEGADIFINGINTKLKTPSTIEIKTNEVNNVSVRKENQTLYQRIFPDKPVSILSFSFPSSTESREVKWDEEEQFTPEYSEGWFSKLGVSIFGPIALNEEGNPKYFQSNMIFGNTRDVQGINISTGVNVTQGGTFKDETLRYSKMEGLQIGFVNIAHIVNGFQLSIFNGTDSVNGVQIGLSSNTNYEDFTGVQMGLGLTLVSLNKNKGDFKGFQYGTLVNVNGGNSTGFQMAGLLNNNTIDNHALQLALIGGNINSGNHYGVQMAGAINLTEKSFYGYMQLALLTNIIRKDSEAIQIGAINSVFETMNSVQVGLVNYAGVSIGFQFGVMNSTKKAQGTQVGLFNYSAEKAKLQIGLINIAKKNRIPILPLVNFDF